MITREDEEQLLIDLSARLKYGVKVYIKLPNHEEKVFEDHVGDLLEITKFGGYLVNVKGVDYRSLSLDIKPYLRPLSSMTEKEIKEYYQLQQDTIHVTFDKYDEGYEKSIDLPYFKSLVDFFNSHHLDYR